MKRLFLIAAALLVGFTAVAQEEETPNYGYKEGAFASVPKVGAYIIGSYKYSDKEGANGGPGFNARLIRAYVDGSIYHQFNYRVQLQFNGGPHVKDFYVEWAKYKFFSVKMGQFKRAFTFENPMNPWDVGAGDFSFLVQKMAGMGDRLGEANMGGRDQGIQIQGDFLPVGKDEHPLFHYQLGLWNGQGINVTDKDLKKDIIGTFQVQPIKGLKLGVFGWKGNWIDGEGNDLKRERISAGVSFDRNNWTFRSEYATAIAGEKAQSGPADALYVTVGVPVTDWFKVYAKWDEFRSAATAETSHDMYSCNLVRDLHQVVMVLFYCLPAVCAHAVKLNHNLK